MRIAEGEPGQCPLPPGAEHDPALTEQSGHLAQFAAPHLVVVHMPIPVLQIAHQQARLRQAVPEPYLGGLVTSLPEHPHLPPDFPAVLRRNGRKVITKTAAWNVDHTIYNGQ